MKKIFIVGLVAALSLLALAPAMADEATTTSSGTPTPVVQAKFVRRAVTVTGTLTSLAGTSAPTTMVLKVANVLPKKAKKWTGIYPTVGSDLTVNIATTTKVIRFYGAKAALSELQVGDSFRLVVKTNEDGTVTAQVVRDNSIHVTVLKTGKITSIDTAGNSLVMTSGKTTLTVMLDSTTKIKIAKVTTPTIANLNVGDAVTVNGLINTHTSTVYKTTSVRVVALKKVTATTTSTSAAQ